MKYIAELVLVFVAITQNVVATWLPAWLLPFGWPFLAATFVIYLAVKFTEGIMPTWATRPRSDRARWVGKWAVAVVGAFLAAWAVERFFYYGDLQVVDKVPLQVFPGEPLEVKGNNFALANAKSNTARLVLADKQSIDLPVTDVSEGKPQRLKVDIPDAVAPGPATLVIDGPLSLIYHNRASVKVDIVGAPKITRIDPPVAFRGKTELKVHGENFDTRIDRQRFKTTVVIGGAVAAVGGTGACQPGPVCLTVKVPEHSPIGSAEMVVSTSGGETSGRIRILGEPRIDHVSPLEAFPHKEGFQDTVITVVGAEFDPITTSKDMHVYVGEGTNAIEATILDEDRSDTQFKFIMPEGAKGGRIVVRTPEGRATTGNIQISVPPAPVIQHFRPTLAKPGETITITGEYLDLETATNNKVKFGGDIAVRADRAYRTAEGANAVDIRIPADARDGNLLVETPSGAAPADVLRIMPLITNFSPSEGTVNSRVTIYGKGFFDPNLEVLFGNLTVRPDRVTPTSRGEDTITFRVPAGSSDAVPIGVRLGPEREAITTFKFRLSRFEEFTGTLIRREASYNKGKVAETLHIDCIQDPGNVLVKMTKPEVKEIRLPLARCPSDIVVDQNTDHAYVADSYNNVIISIDLTRHDKDGEFPSGGAQPARIVLAGGKAPYWQIGGRLKRPNLSNPSGPPEDLEIQGTIKAVHSNNEGQVMVISQENTPSGPRVLLSPRGPNCRRNDNIDLKSKGDYAGSAATQGAIYVANYGSDNITHINFICNPTTTRIDLDAEARPIGLAMNPAQGRPELWVAESGLGRISIIDTNRDQVLTRFEVGPKPRFLIFHPDGCFAYVFTEGDNAVRRLLPAEHRVDGDEMHPRQRSPAENLVFANGAVNLVYRNGGDAWKQSCRRVVK